MLFNSISYMIFLPIVFILYWIIPHKYRWLLILISSYYFYMSWNPKYIVFIFATTLISYISAILIEEEGRRNKKKKKLILAITAIVCLGILFYFKYFNFLSESVVSLLNIFKINANPVLLNVLLPVGISFYTFQTLSYVIDVYRKDIKAEHHFGYYAAFVAFFPQLVAGPIERTSNLLPQIKKKHKFNYEKATYGLKLMAWGYFKKIVIADTLAQYVQLVYNNPSSYIGFSLVLATVFFAVQIYCDFSGYSDIAIGTAKLLDIDLMTNFKSPYFSQSIKEFWSRWHISLSTWFRDYVYIPLGGNRVGKIRHYLNLFITFLVSGLWHGASWTFVIWGGLHGIAQVLENIFIKKKNSSKKIMVFIRTILVFAFVTFTWIFFVSSSLTDAKYVVLHLLTGISHPIEYIQNGYSVFHIKNIELILLLISITILIVFDYLSLKKDVISEISSKKKIIRWIIYVVFILWLILNIKVVNTSEFIYFQF